MVRYGVQLPDMFRIARTFLGLTLGELLWRKGGERAHLGTLRVLSLMGQYLTDRGVIVGHCRGRRLGRTEPQRRSK